MTGGIVPPIDLHDGEQIIFEGHPSWRATLAFYVQGVLAVLVVGVIALLVSSTGVGAGVIAAGIALVVLIGFIKRVATVYTITNQRLRIKRGILSKRIQQTRIDRVQNVNTEQSFRERLLRVGTVDFDTAWTDASEFRFAGISDPNRIATVVDEAQRSGSARG